MSTQENYITESFGLKASPRDSVHLWKDTRRKLASETYAGETKMYFPLRPDSTETWNTQQFLLRNVICGFREPNMTDGLSSANHIMFKYTVKTTAYECTCLYIQFFNQVNHVAAGQCIQSCRSKATVNVHIKHQNGENI